MGLDPESERALNELKDKIHNAETMCALRSVGEMVMVVDASDVGGGAVLMQWQTPDPLQVAVFATKGINPDGSMRHNYPSSLFGTHGPLELEVE